MVSGLVTSPCDQLRIFSGEARLMRMASKSAIGFARSKGLERNKVFLHFLLSRQQPVASGQLPVLMFRQGDRKSTRLNSSHGYISYAVFCLKKKKNNET